MTDYLKIRFDTAEQIALDFMLQQYAWLKGDKDRGSQHPDDIEDAEKDMAALARVIRYMGGEHLI